MYLFVKIKFVGFSKEKIFQLSRNLYIYYRKNTSLLPEFPKRNILKRYKMVKERKVIAFIFAKIYQVLHSTQVLNSYFKGHNLRIIFYNIFFISKFISTLEKEISSNYLHHFIDLRSGLDNKYLPTIYERIKSLSICRIYFNHESRLLI